MAVTRRYRRRLTSVLVVGLVTAALGAGVTGPAQAGTGAGRTTTGATAPSGDRSTADRAQVALPGDGIVRHDASAGPGGLTVTPSSLAVTEKLGQAQTRQLVFGNDGTAPVHVRLDTAGGGSAPTAGQAYSPTGAPKLVQRTTTSYADPVQAAKSRAKPAAGPSAAVHDRQAEPAQADAPGSAWQTIAAYPKPVMDDAVATHDGLVYVVGGSNGTVNYADVNVYDPVSGSWSAVAKMPEPLNGASAAFVDDTLYVAGGWNSSGVTSKHVYAYDPATDTWTRTADLPAALSAAGTAVLQGKLYLVGGCTTGACTPTSNAVYQYDPAAGTWSRQPDYPTPVAFTACGGVGGEVVCAGGVNADADDPLTTTYALLPGAQSWTSRAALPMDAWGAAAAAANGQLEVMGGSVDNSTSVTNQGYAYDPAADDWTALPNSGNTVYRGGGACGAYKVGGTTGQFQAVSSAENLPGYDQCASGVPWLRESSTDLDVAPGQSVAVTVTVDSAKLAQPGDFAAALTVSTDSPYSVRQVAVSLHVDPPASWGQVSGTVTDSAGQPLRGATVQICTMWDKNLGCGTVTYTLRTGIGGDYRLWLDRGYSPLAVVVAKDGYQSQFRIVKVAKGQTTSADFTLAEQ
ncbi:kelch repeat-containing protein [Streptomyces sp. NPDC020917]|uniref:Kelch repeat-containing protein n=1 Tax=Streptomyces sp. NPDC020917 TaxID=3365102 RepID=UPI0037A86D30